MNSLDAVGVPPRFCPLFFIDRLRIYNKARKYIEIKPKYNTYMASRKSNKRDRSPNVAVLAITTHGGIQIDKNGEPKKFRVPEKMTIIKISAATPGVCNYASEDDTQESVESLINLIKTDLKGDKTEFASKAKQSLKKIGDSVSDDLRADLRKDQRANKEMDDSAADFVHHSDKGYQVSVKHSGEEMLDKYYVRNNRIFVGPWDLKMTLLTEEGFPDVMRELKTPKRMNTRNEDETHDVFLSDVISHLKETYNINEVIVADLTCSITGSFTASEIANPGAIEEKYLSKVDERLLRRTLLKEDLHGGKKKKKAKKTRKRRSRKYY
jgi:hypothetical protein